MQNELFDKSHLKSYTIAAFVYLLITLMIFWPMSTSITTKTVAGGADAYHDLWSLWWAPYAIFSLHTSFYYTNLLFYPYGINLVPQAMSPLAGILTFPLQAISLAFTYNIVFILGFVLSGLFMFMLACYIIKDNYASFISGLVFAFNPMHLAQALGHLNWTSVEFLPLFVLLFLLSVKKQRVIYEIFAAVSFLFIAFFGDSEQAVVIVVFLVLFSYRHLSNYKKEKSRLILSTARILFFAIILGLPFFIPVAQSVLFSNVLSVANSPDYNSLSSNVVWSNDLISFFVPSLYNTLFGNLTRSSPIYLYGPGERVAYAGYSVLLLSLLAVVSASSSGKRKTVYTWAFISVVFAAISLGPLIWVDGIMIYAPGPFLILKLIPLINIIRTPGRYVIITFMGLAILAGIGSTRVFSYASKRIGGKGKNIKVLLAILLSLIIITEYIGILPLSPSYFTNQSVPQIYYEFQNITCNCSVLTLPYSQSDVTPSMYLQSVFKKPILGGYETRENLTQFEYVNEIPIANITAFPSTLPENFTSLNLFWMKKYNVGFIIFQDNQSNSTTEASYLTSVFGAPLLQDNSTKIFSTATAFNTLQK